MQKFLTKIRANRVTLLKFFTEVKAQGKTIGAYGAPAKATTLLYFFGLNDMIDFVVDDSPLKSGRYMPGSHVPIVTSEELYKRNPDYLFITAWNFAEPIMEKVKAGGYKGSCIVPFP